MGGAEAPLHAPFRKVIFVVNLSSVRLFGNLPSMRPSLSKTGESALVMRPSGMHCPLCAFAGMSDHSSQDATCARQNGIDVSADLAPATFAAICNFGDVVNFAFKNGHINLQK